MSTIVNLAIRIHGKKGTPLASIKDFIFDWDTDSSGKQTQSVEQMKAILQQVAAMGKTKTANNNRVRTHKPKSLQK